jgi:hypothetical protein
LGLLLALGAVSPAAAELEDVLSGKHRSAPDLIADGYRVVDYEIVEGDEGRMILQKNYKMALCFIEESLSDEESLELESTCYRLR